MGVKVKFLEPEEFYLADQFCDAQGIPRLDPNWSKVIAAIDVEKGVVVGIMAAQMVIHAEPIWIDEAYREQGLWREMADMMDGYLVMVGVAGVYNQPTHPEAEHLCVAMGMTRCEHPLYLKRYDLKAREQWLQQFQPPSG